MNIALLEVLFAQVGGGATAEDVVCHGRVTHFLYFAADVRDALLSREGRSLLPFTFRFDGTKFLLAQDRYHIPRP